MAQVLIIDDDKATRDALRRAFEHAGHGVEEALNGLEGLERFRAQPSDVVITDLHMPGRDGLEMTAELKREFPEAKVIAISAMGQSHNYDFERAAMAMGAAKLIEKPFSIADVVGAVDKLLSGD